MGTNNTKSNKSKKNTTEMTLIVVVILLVFIIIFIGSALLVFHFKYTKPKMNALTMANGANESISSFY